MNNFFQQALLNRQRQGFIEQQRVIEESNQRSREIEARGRKINAIREAVGPFGTQFAGEVGAMLNSGIPALEAAGASRLMQAQNMRAGQDFQRAGLSPIERTELERAEWLTKTAEAEFNRIRKGERTLAERDSLVGGLRDDYYASMQNTSEVITAGLQTANLLAQGDALGAQLATTKLAKAADPGSTVRVEEGKLVAEGTGLAEQIAFEFNRLKGDGYSPEAVAMFTNSIESLIGPRALEGLQIHNQFASLAQRENINLADMTVRLGLDLRVLQAAAARQLQRQAGNGAGTLSFGDLAGQGGAGQIQR